MLATLLESKPSSPSASESTSSLDIPDPVSWITTHFYIPETKAPITLALYQEVALREALSRDPNGLYRYSTIVWSDVKKSAKTTIAAAVAMWVAFSKPHARIRLVGNDLKQSDSRVFNAMQEAIKLHPEWRSTVKVIQHHIVFPNDSTIESVPVDPAGEAGGNDDMIEWTELWAATHDAHKKMWAEMTLSPTKFGQSFRWVDTYAGYQGESEILESLYNQAVKDNHPLDVGVPGLELFANTNARLLVLWNTVPRLDWQTSAYYAQEASSLTDAEFRRMHKNVWVTSSQTFVPSEWWDACKVDRLSAIDRNEPMVIALDASVSGDCFGMMMVSVRDEVRGDKVARIVQPRYVRKWTPPKDGKLDYDDEIEPEIKRLIREHNIVQTCYDPFQLHQFCTRLREQTHAPFEEFNQGQDRLVADKQLYDLIRDRCIEHQGETDLAEHMRNANSKTENERLRIVKRTESLKIDLAVCLSMASARALELIQNAGSFIMKAR